MKKVFLTGSSGWLGQEALSVLAPDCEVQPLSSRSQILTIHSRDISLRSYSELNPEERGDGLISLAFPTKDKVELLGVERYISETRDVIAQNLEVLKTIRPKWVILVSSGAIYSGSNHQLETDIHANPYGFLKVEEESLFKAACDEIGANLFVGRLWAASGALMPIKRAYALSDFIVQALSEETIKVHARSKVWRRYIDAAEFMRVLICAAEAGMSASVDSGGELVEIHELALKIAGLCSAQVESPEIDESLEASNYFPTGQEFEKLAARFGVKISSLHEQIERTVQGHARQMDKDCNL